MILIMLQGFFLPLFAPDSCLFCPPSPDVWSAGCVLAELLLGQPIFPGDSGVDQLVEIIKVSATSCPPTTTLQIKSPVFLAPTGSCSQFDFYNNNISSPIRHTGPFQHLQGPDSGKSAFRGAGK